METLSNKFPLKSESIVKLDSSKANNIAHEPWRKDRILCKGSSVPLCETILLLIRTSNRETPANLVQKLKLLKTDSESGSFAKNSSICSLKDNKRFRRLR